MLFLWYKDKEKWGGGQGGGGEYPDQHISQETKNTLRRGRVGGGMDVIFVILLIRVN
jgi:hypothetical protein